MHAYICTYIYLHVQLFLRKILRSCSQPFLQSPPVRADGNTWPFLSSGSSRGHHKVQDSAGAAGEWPQGTTDGLARGGSRTNRRRIRRATAWESSGTPHKTLGTSAWHLHLIGNTGKHILQIRQEM